MPLGPWELLIILLFVLLLFGARKLPEMGRALGISMRGFKEEITARSSDDVHEHGPVEEIEPVDEHEPPAAEPQKRTKRASAQR
jgi:sec-independent protein translocase protein TatA